MRKHRHIIIPLLILIYLAAMTFIFGRDLIAAGESTRLYTICGCELLIVVLLFFTLKKQNQLRNKREQLSQKPKSKP